MCFVFAGTLPRSFTSRHSSIFALNVFRNNLCHKQRLEIAVKLISQCRTVGSIHANELLVFGQTEANSRVDYGHTEFGLKPGKKITIISNKFTRLRPKEKLLLLQSWTSQQLSWFHGKSINETFTRFIKKLLVFQILR